MGMGRAACTAQCSAPSVARSCRSQAHLHQQPLILVNKSPQEDLCPVTKGHSLKPRCNQLWQGQEGLSRIYCQGQLEAKGPHIYIHTPFVLMYLQQYQTDCFNGTHTIIISKFLIRKKANKKSIQVITWNSNITFASESKRTIWASKYNFNCCKFLKGCKKMALILSLPACVNKVSSQRAH